jgi:hypothetical protein
MIGWWATLLVGLAVLLFGRRLFWLFVGAAGFAVGLHAARVAWADAPEWLVVVAALVLGVLGAVLAILFQWLAVGLGGFAVGVHVSLLAADALSLNGPWLWAVVFAAGIAVAALAVWLWDPILILLSALTGAALLAPLIPMPRAAQSWIFVGLLIAGIVVQARILTPADGGRPPRRRGA